MATKAKQIILQVLELYKEMPFLWDKNHKDYKNKDSRNEGYRVLLEVYKEFKPNATMKLMKKKIQNLRTNYAKELKKVKDSNRTGASVDDIYIPNVYYFDALSFLEAYSEPCCMTRDPLGTEDISSDEEKQSKYLLSDVSHRKKKRLTQTSLHTKKRNKIMTTARELLNFKEKEKEEDWEVLGKSIGLQLRDLDKTKLRITQKIISDTIYYASIGTLTHNSFIALGPPVTRDLPYASPSTSSSCRNQEPYHTSFPLKCHTNSDSQSPCPSTSP